MVIFGFAVRVQNGRCLPLALDLLQIMSYKKVMISFATSYRGQFNEASPLDFTLSVLKFYHHIALTYKNI